SMLRSPSSGHRLDSVRGATPDRFLTSSSHRLPFSRTFLASSTLSAAAPDGRHRARNGTLLASRPSRATLPVDGPPRRLHGRSRGGAFRRAALHYPLVGTRAHSDTQRFS